MSDLNIHALAALAKRALDEQTNGKTFMLNDVYTQTRMAYERFPEDPVIRQMAFTIERMLDNSKKGETITQAKLSDIYNNFVRLSSNSKFRNVLGHLLLEQQAIFSSKNEEFINLNRVDSDNSKMTNKDFADQTISNELDAAFDSKVGNNTYDSRLAERGAFIVGAELKALGFDKSRVEILGGNKDFVVYAAHLDSIKGLVSIAIPVELKNDIMSAPSVFLVNNRLENLTAENINNLITNETANTDTIITNTESRTDIDITPKVQMPKELAHLANDFENDVLEAVSIFGSNAINAGKQLIAVELRAAGFKNAQVRFASESTDSVIYLAEINTPKGKLEIEIPIEMQYTTANKFLPLMPNYFAYDGLIEDFTTPKLQRFAISVRIPSTGTKTLGSSYSYMLLPELKDEILKSASENDYVACEMILDYIGNKFAEEDYKNAIADYQFLLMTKANISVQEQHKCSRMIAAGHGSIHQRCAHYMVTMDKIIAGPNGECVLKTSVERQKLNPIETSGASISTSKIILT